MITLKSKFNNRRVVVAAKKTFTTIPDLWIDKVINLQEYIDIDSVVVIECLLEDITLLKQEISYLQHQLKQEK
jgi:hypothetical protein